jgi:hypothetical protein
MCMEISLKPFLVGTKEKKIVSTFLVDLKAF